MSAERETSPLLLALATMTGFTPDELERQFEGDRWRESTRDAIAILGSKYDEALAERPINPRACQILGMARAYLMDHLEGRY